MLNSTDNSREEIVGKFLQSLRISDEMELLKFYSYNELFP